MIKITNIGEFDNNSGFINLTKCSDGFYEVGKDGVISIVATGDRKVEFISWENMCLAYVISAIGHHAYYPIYKTKIEYPIKAVLMDLDGTSVKSEEFWIWIIQKSIASLIGNDDFVLEEADLPHVSGHSVSEHLQYCISKYCPDKKLEDARKWYFYHTEYEMNEIMEGRGKEGAFTPNTGIKEFLLELKKRNIKIGLATSGLYQKAWPEIKNAFDSLKMGDPKDFYD
ncbi:MAG: HAD hydrolase-like protein, partial [Bacilli bacterium]|nr:HAD hydrolase-like protein [Bacilli bacterium]